MCRFLSSVLSLPTPLRLVLGGALAAVTALAVHPAGARAVAHGTVVGQSAARWEATLVTRSGATPINQREVCSGSLIAPNVMLTAGHCAGLADPGEIARVDEVLVGNQPLSSGRDKVVAVRATRIDPAFAIHSNPIAPGDVGDDSASGDISLIILAHPVIGVTPLTLGPWPSSGTPVTMYGHGITGDTDPSDSLQVGSFQIGVTSRCALATPAPVEAATMGCAEGRSQACGGDSGSPLVVGHGGGGEVVGVLSFGMETDAKPCGSPGPSFFARVSSAEPWLSTQLHRFSTTGSTG